MIFIVNAIATALWMALIWGLDEFSRRKKSGKTPVVFMLAGMASMLPTLFLYQLSPIDVFEEIAMVSSKFIMHLFIVGPVEECSKFITFLLLARRFAPIREPRDGILYAAAVAVGFAAVENLWYGNEYGLYTLAVRSVLCTTGHVVFGATWGFSYALAVYEGARRGGRADYPLVLMSLAIASFVHGLYNFFVEISLVPVAVSLILIAVVVSLLLLRFYKKQSPYRKFSLAEYPEAVAAYKKALAVNPDDGVINKRIALFYLYGNRFRESLAHLERAVRADPGNAYLRCLRGAVIVLCGERDRGTTALARGLKKLPGRQHEILRKNIGRLVRDASRRDEILAMLAPAGGGGSARRKIPAGR